MNSITIQNIEDATEVYKILANAGYAAILKTEVSYYGKNSYKTAAYVIEYKWKGTEE